MKPKTVSRITINGNRFRVVYAAVFGPHGRQFLGRVCHDRNEITFDYDMPEEEWRRIYIHELLHAAVWYLGEEAVDNLSRKLDEDLNDIPAGRWKDWICAALTEWFAEFRFDACHNIAADMARELKRAGFLPKR